MKYDEISMKIRYIRCFFGRIPHVVATHHVEVIYKSPLSQVLARPASRVDKDSLISGLQNELSALRLRVEADNSLELSSQLEVARGMLQKYRESWHRQVEERFMRFSLENDVILMLYRISNRFWKRKLNEIDLLRGEPAAAFAAEQCPAALGPREAPGGCALGVARRGLAGVRRAAPTGLRGWQGAAHVSAARAMRAPLAGLGSRMPLLAAED